MQQDLIIILDLGSQYNSHVARTVRELGVYSEIYAHDITKKQLENLSNVKGIILNGGPNNIVDGKAIDVARWLYTQDIPLLLIDHFSPHKDTHISKLSLTNDDLDQDIKNSLSQFIFDTCSASANWSMKNFVSDQVAAIRKQVGNKKVLLALSGGVDSSVVAALLIKAVGKQLYCVHVDHGLMRKNESKEIIDVFGKMIGENLNHVDASERFLSKLEGISDPEEKRMIIGNEFIRVFEEESTKLGKMDFLAQGTIYPDIAESATKTGKGIKSHHNVGALPKDMEFELIEPLKFLFKDEVRQCGLELGLPPDLVFRQPFPGPGLAVRCLGTITKDRLTMVRESDAILREEFYKSGLSNTVWQYFTVVPEFRSTGVRDGVGTYEYPVIFRAVNSVDAMTAHVEEIPWPIMQKITSRILNEVNGVSRVLYDLSPKPPATIEWE